VIESQSRGNRLHLALETGPEDLFEPEYAADAPIIRFTAYRDNGRVFGWLRMRARRLTDLLNTHTELHLRDAEIEDFGTGVTQAVEEVLIARSELIAVTAGDPRGDPTMRHPTWTHPIAVQCGNYLVGGYLHAVPGATPVAAFNGRPTMIPLTYAWIEHWSGDNRSIQSTGTIVVNRDKVDWMRVVTDDDLINGQLRRSR
jgi:hypothetical protein